MRKFFLAFVVLSAFFVSTISYATCYDDVKGGWRCFYKGKQNKISTGDCKNMDCPDGCVEAKNGHYGHCCSQPTQTDCRADVYDEGCLIKTKIKCSSKQFCDKNGKCKNKKGSSK